MAIFRLVLALVFCLVAGPAAAQEADKGEKVEKEPVPAEVGAAEPAAEAPAEEAPAEPQPDQLWYYREGGETKGPVPADKIRELLTQKKINGSAHVTRKDWDGKWTHVGWVDLFQDKVLWFYATQEGKKGPVSSHRMSQLLALKQITPKSLAWRSGMKAWKPVSTLPELALPPGTLGTPPIKGEGPLTAVEDPDQGAPPPVPAAEANPAEPPAYSEAAPAEAAPPPVESAYHSAPPVKPVPVRTSARRWMLLMGGGFSFGFFSPGDVNNYIEGGLGNAKVEQGVSGMFLNLVPRLSIAFAPIEYVQVTAIGEIGWGPKIIQVRGSSSSSTSYSFVRYSGGAIVTGHIPLKNYRMSLFGGGGIMYHWMEFEGYEAGTPGFRGLVGLRIAKKVFTPEIWLGMDYAKANDGGFELNYTGVTIGATFHFKVTGS